MAEPEMQQGAQETHSTTLHTGQPPTSFSIDTEHISAKVGIHIGQPSANLGKRKRESTNETIPKVAARAIAREISDQLLDTRERCTKNFSNIAVNLHDPPTPNYMSFKVEVGDIVPATRRAVDEHKLNDEARHAYFCDGSVLSPRQNGATGVAVVWKQSPAIGQSRWVARGFPVTPNLTSIEAEGMAIIQALTIAIQKTLRRNLTRVSVIIYTDSQSILSALTDTSKWVKNVGTRHVVQRIALVANRLEENAVDLSFRWCPSHIGIPGNQLADKIACRAAEYALRLGGPPSQSASIKESRRVRKLNAIQKTIDQIVKEAEILQKSPL